MTRTPSATGTPGVTREFVGMDLADGAAGRGRAGIHARGSTTAAWGASRRSR